MSARWKGSLALQVAADHAEAGRPQGRLKLLAADGARVESYSAREGRPDREVARFLSKVPKVKPNECAIWQGNYLKRACKDGKPLARFQLLGAGRYKRGKIVLAGRYAWELVHGPIKKGGVIYRTCFDSRCVNVRHLWVGTKADLSAYMAGIGFLPAKHERSRGNGPVQRKAKVIMARIRADFAELEKLHTRCYRAMRKELKLMRRKR